MKGLLIKDTQLMLQRKRFFILIAIIGVVIAYSGDPNFVVGYISLIASLFCISTISYDEYDNCYAYLLSLPVTRKVYVIGKYVFGILLGVVSWSLGMFICYCAKAVRGISISKESVIQNAVMLPIILILISIILPFIIKYGAERGRIVMLITVGAIAGIAFIMLRIMERLQFDIENNISHLLQALSLPYYVAGMILVLLISILSSIFISIKIMNNKEL